MVYRRWGKRFLDVCVATVLLVALLPVLAAVAVVTFLAHGSPILFRQVRPGLKGAPFTIFKFRSMRDAVDANGAPIDDHLRTTRVGGFLRRSSLDELPELLNVIRGEMSLVGPRPLMLEYLPRYSPEQARRHDVRPGITGLAQISGRNAISWDEKFAYDLEYIDSLSFALDARILVATIAKIFRGSDVNAGKTVTMSEFVGTSPPDSQEG